MLDGRSQGRLVLVTPLPVDAVPCIGACGSTVAALTASPATTTTITTAAATTGAGGGGGGTGSADAGGGGGGGDGGGGTQRAAAQGGGAIDGNALLIDDDGVGYVAYATIDSGPGRRGDHMVAIDRLKPDYIGSTGQMAAPIFPDTFVEGVMFFKREGQYYIIYSSCCCCCTAGAGAVVYRARNISGPWVRQGQVENTLIISLPLLVTLPSKA